MEPFQTQYSLIPDSYNQNVLKGLIQKQILQKSIPDLTQFVISLENQYDISTQEVDIISICRQILVQRDKGLDSVTQAEYLTESTIRILNSQPKSEERYHRCVKILTKASQISVPSWYHKPHTILLQLTSLPTQKDVAQFAFEKVITSCQDDLIISIRNWIQFFVLNCSTIPPQLFQMTNKLFNAVNQEQLAPQYKGQYYFLRGFILHYYGNKSTQTMNQIIKFYDSSLQTGDQIYWQVTAIQSGKYNTMFHFAKLLKRSQIYGFSKDFQNIEKAQLLEKMKQNLLQNGQAQYQIEIVRCLGFQGNLTGIAQWINYRLGQSDNLDQNYLKAIRLIKQVLIKQANRLNVTSNYQLFSAWIYLNKPHLFENSYKNAITEIISSLKQQMSLFVNPHDFSKNHLEMAITIMSNQHCQVYEQIKQLQEIIEKISNKYGPKVASFISGLKNKYKHQKIKTQTKLKV